MYHVILFAGNYNGAVEYNGDGWDGGRSFGGRGRGRGRGRAFRGRGRGYGGQPGGYYDYGELRAPPAQGRGRFLFLVLYLHSGYKHSCFGTWMWILVFILI